MWRRDGEVKAGWRHVVTQIAYIEKWFDGRLRMGSGIEWIETQMTWTERGIVRRNEIGAVYAKDEIGAVYAKGREWWRAGR
jgi:hypothetical protein